MSDKTTSPRHLLESYGWKMTENGNGYGGYGSSIWDSDNREESEYNALLSPFYLNQVGHVRLGYNSDSKILVATGQWMVLWEKTIVRESLGYELWSSDNSVKPAYGGSAGQWGFSLRCLTSPV